MISAAEMAGLIVSVVLGGCMGFFLARRLNWPKGIWTWLVAILALLISPYIGVSTYLLAILEFKLVVSWMLVAFSLGILIRMIGKKLSGLRTPNVRTP